MIPQLPPHWESPVAAAIACVVSSAVIEASASLSPLANRPTLAGEISLLSGFVLRYASIATEAAVVIALTLISGLVILAQRAATPEARLRLALQITTLGFAIALVLTLTAFIALFVIPNAQGGF